MSDEQPRIEVEIALSATDCHAAASGDDGPEPTEYLVGLALGGDDTALKRLLRESWLLGFLEGRTWTQEQATS